MLAGAEPLTQAKYRLGHNVQTDYFAQDQYKELDPNARMLDDLSSAAPEPRAATELRSLLGCFLFSEDDVFKRIGVLSGGERNRYASRGCCCSPPTSCCSTSRRTTSTCAPRTCSSKRSQEYTGTVVFVSHDRYFIDKLATRVFEIGGGEVRSSPATTKTICGASAESRSLPSTRWPLVRSSKPHRRRPHQLNNRPRAASIPSSCNK